MLKVLLWIFRLLLAFTFILSGFVKGVDPLGSAYKFGDYFSAFGMDALNSFALPLAFMLCAAELFIGLILLFNVWPKVGAWASLLFMAIFTPLTFALAIFNPVSDCGCFGDAIILTNWETFFKNVPLLGASIGLVVYRKHLSSPRSLVYQTVIAVLLGLVSYVPSFHGYRNLPLMDFRPYSIGSSIIDGMTFPENAPMDQYRTSLFYEKDGVVKEFTQENFPWQDSTWAFVDSKSVLVSKGYTPPIDNFVLTNYNGWELTDSVLHYPGYFILAVSNRIDEVNAIAVEKLNELYFKAKEEGIGFVCLTASPLSEIDRFVSTTGVAFPFLMADDIMLKTTIRANPGIILLNEGTVIGKWHYRNIPEPSFFEGNLTAKALSEQRSKNQNLWIILLVVITLAVKLTLFPLIAKLRS